MSKVAASPPWWPDFLPYLIETIVDSGTYCNLALITNTFAGSSYLQVFSFLVPPDVADAVLEAEGETVGVEVSANGPRPDASGGQFVPRFWIHGGDISPRGFEPVVNAWISGNVTTL